MNDVLEKIYSDGFVTGKNDEHYPINTSAVWRDTGAYLYHLVKQYKPQKSLEVGLAFAISTMHICQALQENGSGSHITIDPFEELDYKSLGLLNLKRAGLEGLVTHYERPSHQMLGEFDARGEKFDFCFIDGSHLFDYALTDFFLVDKVLKVGGIVVMDDLWMPSVRRAVTFILRNRDYSVVRPLTQVSVPPGLAMLRIGRRLLQGLPGYDLKLKLLPHNVIVLRKEKEDDRHHLFYRKF